MKHEQPIKPYGTRNSGKNMGNTPIPFVIDAQDDVRDEDLQRLIEVWPMMDNFIKKLVLTILDRSFSQSSAQ